jgi:hypothetical protein
MAIMVEREDLFSKWLWTAKKGLLSSLMLTKVLTTPLEENRHNLYYTKLT